MGTDPLDRNKTNLTHKITALASAYLDVLGCKPIETEVPLSDGKITDIASFTYPTMTELKQGKLLKRIIGDEVFGNDNRADLFRYRYGEILTVAVEVKISLSDFKKDLGRKYDLKKHIFIPAHLYYLAMPRMVIEKIEGIANHRYWGLITCSDNGEKILKIEPPWFVNPLHSYQIIDLIAQVAIRRDHRTRYRVMRDFLKSYRAGRRNNAKQT